ncbi:MAG: biopolymer transporter ExbD [Pirellulales bacterium]
MKIPRLAERGAVGINMTPLIDVVFQLLIFFLVSSHLARQEAQMALPLPTAASGAESRAEDERPRITLNVLADGALVLVGRRIQPTQLEERLRGVVAEEGAEVELRVRADRDVPYRHVEPVLVASSRAGLANVTFAVVDSEVSGKP